MKYFLAIWFASCTTAPMIVVLIQFTSSALVSWVIVTIKFEEVEISGKFLLASALGVPHLGPSTTLGIAGLAHLDASISSIIWALEAAMNMVLVSTGIFYASVNCNENNGSSSRGNGGNGLSLPKFN